MDDNKKLLSDIGRIITGLNFYKTKLYGPKDLEDDKSYALIVKTTNDKYKYSKLVEPEYIQVNRNNKHHLLQEGDVVIYTGKKKLSFAWAYESTMDNIIVSHTFKVLYTKNNIVNSKYLAYYLNEYYFKNNSNSIINVKDIKIDLPTLDKQNLIVSILKHYNKEIDNLNRNKCKSIDDIINDKLKTDVLQQLKLMYNE
jgi:restriction endonuclease S subunit